MKRLDSGSLSTRVARFLLSYFTCRTDNGQTPVYPAGFVTTQSPQECMYRQKQACNAYSQSRQFDLGSCVYAQNYGHGLLGSAMCKIRLKDQRIIRRHLDQLCICNSALEMTSADRGTVTDSDKRKNCDHEYSDSKFQLYIS